MFRNGTDLEAAGRWRDGSLVRWRDGVMQPVGGWRERSENTIPSVARAAFAWQDNSGDRWIAFGQHDGLHVMSASGAVSNITPTGFTSGLAQAAINTGFGGGFFGLGFFGTARADTGNYSEATTWSLSSWGEFLIGCSSADGTIYEWQLSPSTPPSALSNAPVDCLAAHVTEERFVFALGAGGNPRKVQWCDREDNTIWAPAATNEAGSFEIGTSGQIMCAVSVRGQTLILTDIDAHVANYIGPPFVYGFEEVGAACGVISRKAAVNVEGGAIWMGNRGFYVYRGGTVDLIPCEVVDRVFQDLNRNQQSIVNAVLNVQNGEVWWFYPSGSSNECDRYVSYSYREGHWAFGEIDRTCGVDRGIFAQPIWVDPQGTVYDHETGTNYDGSAVFAESGPLTLAPEVVSVNQLIPDEVTQGDVSATFKTRFYPNDAETSHGPYSMAAPTDVRFTGRQVRMRVTGERLTQWRWGIPRLRVQQRGRR